MLENTFFIKKKERKKEVEKRKKKFKNTRHKQL